MIPEQVQLDMGQAKVSFLPEQSRAGHSPNLCNPTVWTKKNFPPVFRCFLLPGYYTRSFPRDVAAAAAAAAATAATVSPNPIQ